MAPISCLQNLIKREGLAKIVVDELGAIASKLNSGETLNCEELELLQIAYEYIEASKDSEDIDMILKEKQSILEN